MIDPSTIISNASCVVFDFDGVIADSEEFQYRVWCCVLKSTGIVSHALSVHSIAGIPDRLALEQSVPGLSPKEYSELTTLKKRICKEQEDSIEPITGAVDLLQSLQVSKRLFLCSSAARPVIQKFLNRVCPQVVFEKMITAEECVQRKPNPEPYRRILEFAGVDASEAAAIEDSLAGITSAVGAGVRVIMFDRYNKARHEVPSVSCLTQLMPGNVTLTPPLKT